MEYTRRMFIETTLGLTFAAASRSLGVLSDSQKRDQYSDYMSLEIPDIRELGTNPPKRAEVEKAQALLAACPSGAAPIEAMKYLVTLPDRNQEDEAYNAGWRDRWNPVIVTFFDSTEGKPSGDETFWCAACLNWVLYRSGYKPTCSASSSSFRHAGKATLSPEPGDIVVFVHTDQDLARAGRGHVGVLSREQRRKLKSWVEIKRTNTAITRYASKRFHSMAATNCVCTLSGS